MKPILFSSPMVRAIIEGRKTQTRRVIKLPPTPTRLGEWEPSTYGGPGVFRIVGNERKYDVPIQACIWHTRTGVTIASPYLIGTNLWVRETFRFDTNEKEETITFKADGTVHHVQDNAGLLEEKDFGRWKPSIFMPRWASRLMLEITDVRCERLQEISEEDAKAEGCEPIGNGNNLERYRSGYMHLWNKINGKTHPWESNPWVWVVVFDQTREKVRKG